MEMGRAGRAFLKMASSRSVRHRPYRERRVARSGMGGATTRARHDVCVRVCEVLLTIRMATKQASVVFQSPPVAAAFPTRTL